MKGDLISINGEITTAGMAEFDPAAVLGANFIYQRIHTLAHSPLQADAHTEIAEMSFQALYGASAEFSAELLAKEIKALLAANRYSMASNQVVMYLFPPADSPRLDAAPSAPSAHSAQPAIPAARPATIPAADSAQPAIPAAHSARPATIPAADSAQPAISAAHSARPATVSAIPVVPTARTYRDSAPARPASAPANMRHDDHSPTTQPGAAANSAHNAHPTRLICCEKPLLYKGYAMQHTGLSAVITPYEYPFAPHKTAVSLAAHSYAESYARRMGADVAIAENYAGILTGVGENPLFAVVRDTVFTTPIDDGAAESVERRLGIAACHKASLELVETPLKSTFLSDYEELFTITPQGIVSIRRCGDRLLPHSMARNLAGWMKKMI